MRFTTLLVRLTGASRDTLSDTLADLTANGLVSKVEAGYALTEAGRALGEPCREATRVIPAAGLLQIGLKKWPLLVLAAIARGHARFTEIASKLPGITPGALSPALKDLERAGLIERTVTEGYPPAVSYAVNEAGRAVLPTVLAIIDAAEGLLRRPS